MTLSFLEFVPSLDLFPMLAGVLAAVACGVLGNFLVLRRLSLMGDAISHAVLPGLVIAFMVTASRDPLAMFVGAAAAGLVTVVLVEVVKKLGRVESGAAMGVVFSVLFALGVLLIEVGPQRGVDLDADCVLNGEMTTLVWRGAPETLAGVFDWETVRAMPRQVWVLVGAAVVAIVFVVGLFKELRIAAFDPALATAQGFHATLLHYLLMVLVAVATVASFEAVGSILVIAMLICPAATARLLTDRLSVQVAWSVVIAVLSGVLGYLLAAGVPAMFGKDQVNPAGAIAATAGVLLVVAIVGSPRHGVVAKRVRRGRLAVSIAREDVLGLLYRAEESAGDGGAGLAVERVRETLPGRRVLKAVRRSARAGEIERRGETVGLTERGRAEAERLVRRHRLWERYLVDEAGLLPDHVHATAEMLEHLPTEPPSGARLDPHGRDIPG
ncbi:MAG: metal ABC transporter permease [Phycisphaerales bacterium JB065]